MSLYFRDLLHYIYFLLWKSLESNRGSMIRPIFWNYLLSLISALGASSFLPPMIWRKKQFWINSYNGYAQSICLRKNCDKKYSFEDFRLSNNLWRLLSHSFIELYLRLLLRHYNIVSRPNIYYFIWYYISSVNIFLEKTTLKCAIHFQLLKAVVWTRALVNFLKPLIFFRPCFKTCMVVVWLAPLWRRFAV